MDRQMAFSDSNDVSTAGNSSTTCCAPTRTQVPPPVPTQISSALIRLCDTLESLLTDASSSGEFDYFSDARLISFSGKEIPVHRCILSARSVYFRNLFVNKEKNMKLHAKELLKDFEVGYDALLTVLVYIYSGKIRALPKGVCTCVDEECDHLACRPAIGFMAEVLYASCVFQVDELVDMFQRNLMDILSKATAEDALMVLSIANLCATVCESLLARSIDVVVRSDLDVITLDKALPQHLVKQINDCRKGLGLLSPESNSLPDKHVRRIHRALESDDVELVRMLLKEERTDLDDAYALHYAVAYCDSKTTAELLDLAIADVNHKNQRGYTVLHVAAMRKDPKIIVSLLTKGARPSDLTPDGRKALQISKRLTRAFDYYKSTEEGKATPKDRLCIEILEQAERRDPLLGEASLSLAVAGDDLREKLLYLENRVFLATVLFPVEAKVAMDIAQVDATSEFRLNGLNNAERTDVDLNEAPFKIKEEHLHRLRALSKTVELGKRYFPRCSAVINKIMDRDDYIEIANATPEEDCPLKKQRRLELEEVLNKAYTEDKEEYDRTVNSSSSSSSVGMKKPNGNNFAMGQ